MWFGLTLHHIFLLFHQKIILPRIEPKCPLLFFSCEFTFRPTTFIYLLSIYRFPENYFRISTTFWWQRVWNWTLLFLVHLNVCRSRHTSGRSYLKPYGNTNYEFVELGNTLACRCILLILVAHWRGLRWLLEQPDGSFLQYLPRFQWLLQVIKATMMFIAMGTTIPSYSVHGYDINDIIKYLCLYAVLCE